MNVLAQDNLVMPKHDNNTLMVLSMSFAGFLFLAFFYSFSHLLNYDTFTDAINSLLGIGSQNQQSSNVATAIIIGLTCYSLGFIFYCLSYIFITLPTYYFFKNHLAEIKCNYIVQSLAGLTEETRITLIGFKPPQKLGFLYLLLRSNNSNLSKEMKFLFNQIMFARTCLLIMFSSLFICTIFKLSDSATLLDLDSIILIFLNIFTYIICTVIYYFAILFWDNAIYSSFVINSHYHS